MIGVALNCLIEDEGGRERERREVTSKLIERGWDIEFKREIIFLKFFY